MLGWIKAAETGVCWPVVVLQCSESVINWHCVGDGSSVSPQEILKDFCFIGNSNSSWTDFYPLIPVLLCEHTLMKQHCIPCIWIPSSYRADVNDCLFLSASQTQWNKKWMRFSFTLCISREKKNLFPVAGFFLLGMVDEADGAFSNETPVFLAFEKSILCLEKLVNQREFFLLSHFYNQCYTYNQDF